MTEPDFDPEPDGDGTQVKLTLSMYKYQREQIEDLAERRGMNLSEYMRTIVHAGERQLIALEQLADEDNRGEIEAQLLDELPEQEADAVDPDVLLDEVLDPIEATVYTILKTHSSIQYSPAHEGYYLE